MNDSLSYSLAVLVVLVIIFFIFRGVLLWYWKIFEILAYQREQLNEQKATNTLLKEQNELLNRMLTKDEQKLL